ncbi:MAG: class I adenylate-forming enzyme family protein [Gammaproteobacteria bacterium]|nr:class I adenylate-forming enzyme family protein [Gammaproteobacteria bacterium]
MDKAAISAAVRAATAPGEPFETTVRRVNGVDYTTFVRGPEHLRDLYAEGLSYADRDFLVYEQERYTFQDSWDLAAKCANRLWAEGIRPGDRVGIALRNYPEWAFAYMGITSIGAITVAMNAWWTAEEMIYGIEDSGLSVLFVDRERLERIGGHAKRLGVDLVTVRCRKEGWRTWEAFVADASETMPEVELDGDDDAMILYTSGSTAHPKGVLSIHRSIVQALLCWEASGAIGRHLWPELARRMAESEDLPAVILAVPLFHVSGVVVQLLQSFRQGRKVVCMYRWDPEEALSIIEAERITSFNGVPIMAWELVQSPNYDKFDLSSLRVVGGGGAPMPPEQSRGINEKVSQGGAGTGWGMTETQGLATTIGGEALTERPTSCGRATPPLAKVRVVDENGDEVPCGESGELCIWGVMNFKCYWNRPEETAQTLVDGWVHTGDVGHMDEDGFVFITDRKKDMILRGGENIGCQEVEAVLYQHPGVAECAVFGVPDERLGEAVAAVVMLRPGSGLGAEALKRYAGEHLAQFKIPEHIWLQDGRLPRTASEKIFKRQLREAAIVRLRDEQSAG